MKTNINWNIIKSKLFKYIKNLIIMILIIIVITFTLSKFIDLSFKKLLEYASIIIIFIGVLSLVGSSDIMRNTQYNYQKFSTGITNSIKRDLNLISDSYKFFLFMIISGVIIYIISLIF